MKTKSDKLKFYGMVSITGKGKEVIILSKASGLLKCMAILGCLLFSISLAENVSGKKKNIPMLVPESKKEDSVKIAPASEAGVAFQELNFNKTLVIEGRVEKPQVQFTLLKEPPPEKEIKFETSFMQNILKADRENTFNIKEAINRN
jgi:hypothetical protein